MKKLMMILILLVSIIACQPAFGQVSTTTTEIQYAGNGSSTEFAFNFPLPGDDTSDLTVILRLVSTGVPVTLTETTHYTVTATNNEFASGGTVTTVATYSSDYTLTIRRDSPDTQEADITTDSGVLRKAVLEGAIDKNTMLIQQQQTDLNRTPGFPASDPTSSLGYWPNSIDRKGLVAAFDSTTGAPTAIDAIPDGSTAITAYAKTYLDDATAAATQNTLGAIPVFNVKNILYGAAGDGDGAGAGTDDTAAIQAAIDAARDVGGGIVIIPDGIYLTSSTLTLYDGVRLLGTGDSYNGTGGNGTGTVLNITGNAPGITVNGATGYGFEIAHMHILGDGDAVQDGIYLVQSGGSVPRSASIHDISIKSAGRDGIRLDGYSFMSLDRITISTAGAHGVNIVDDTATPKQEYLWISNTSINGCTGNGFNFTTGILTYLNKCDSSLNAKGLVISGDVFQINSSYLSISQNTSQGIEIYADSTHITRLSFRDTFIHMVGDSVAEKAIYTHRAAAWNLQFVYFDIVDITKNGATSPTTAVDIDTTFIDSELINIRNASGGAVSLPTDISLKYTDADKQGVQALANNATPTIQGGKNYITSGTTTITDLDDGYTGQEIIIIAQHATPFTDGTNIFLKDSTNWTMAATDTLSLIYKNDNLWYETGRSHNASSSVGNIICYDGDVVTYENEVLTY